MSTVATLDSGDPTTPVTAPASNLANPTKVQDPTREEIPLDSPFRTEPIHKSIPEVKLSANAPSVTDTTKKDVALNTLHPTTLQPFTIEELRTHKLELLLSQYPTPESAAKAREDTALELRKLLDENERRNREIDRELEEKEKTREMERKVFASRKLAKDV